MKVRASHIFAVFLFVLSTATFVFLIPAIYGDKAGNMDFISYWAAGKQLSHGENPYDIEATFRLQRGAGLTENSPDMLLNMPNALILFLPLGLVSAKTGMAVWLLTSILCLMASIRMLWILFGRPDNALHLLGFVFAPVIACLFAGQLGMFLLFGVVLFLYFHESRPFWAGAALLLCTLKPHLFLAFGIVVLAWLLNRRAYRILAGAATFLIGNLAVTYFVDPHAWSEYTRLMNDYGIQRAFVPALSVVFRLLVDRDAVWLQYVPALAACGWGLWYFSSRRDRWSWMHHGLLLLLVSEACAPHAYLPDEVIVLPAILASLYRTRNPGRVLLTYCTLTGIVLIEIANHLKLTSILYLWTAPAWLALYLYAHHNKSVLTDELVTA